MEKRTYAILLTVVFDLSVFLLMQAFRWDYPVVTPMRPPIRGITVQNVMVLKPRVSQKDLRDLRISS